MHLLGLAFIFVVISLHVNVGLAYSLPRSNKAGIILTLFPFVAYNLIWITFYFFERMYFQLGH